MTFSLSPKRFNYRCFVTNPARLKGSAVGTVLVIRNISHNRTEQILTIARFAAKTLIHIFYLALSLAPSSSLVKLSDQILCCLENVNRDSKLSKFLFQIYRSFRLSRFVIVLKAINK